MKEEKELNLVEILKDAPRGMKLYSPIFGDCKLETVNVENGEIYVRANAGYYTFYKKGSYYKTCGECLLFPSKDNRDWSTFKVEGEGFKVGDHIMQNETGRVYFLTRKEYDGFRMKKVNCSTDDYNCAGWMADENLKEGYKKVEKFDPKWLKSFDRVLVRDSKEKTWFAPHFSHLGEEKEFPYVIGNGCGYEYCIPCNAETEHLVGTRDDEPEFYQV